MTDITGKRYGRLTVIEPDTPCDKDHGYRWIVRCDCGTTFSAYRHNLVTGLTRSCGCLRRETMLKNRRNSKRHE